MLGTGKSAAVIVVADDDAATRYVVSSTLAHEGFTVIEASDGREAVEAFGRASPDVILMDVEMPGINGYEACSRIRRSPGGADLPIVMVTGHDDSTSIKRAYEAGATDFIAKPINWSLIGHRLHYILRGARNFQALGVSEAENRALVAAMPDTIFVVDAGGVILNHLSGDNAPDVLSSVEACGSKLDRILPPELCSDIAGCIASVLSTRHNTSIEFRLNGPESDTSWYEGRFVYHGAQKVLVIVRDISGRKIAENKIHTLAYFDALTGLPNRQFFKEKFEGVLASAEAGNRPLAVLHIDLNRFKRINDTLGTTTGDAVLVEMALRLSNYVAGLQNGVDAGALYCSLASFGGDEFALLVGSDADSLEHKLVAEQLRKHIATPLSVNGHEFVVTASIGTAVFPEHGRSAETLLKNAESAKDEAKSLGSNICSVYRSSMNSSVTDCLNLENELRRAIENDELCMYYQPKYHPGTLEHCGAEALVRWFHRERGEIPPKAFIPIAEESGIITDLGRWIANTVCEQIASWQYFGISPGPVAINMSGQEFGLGNPLETLTRATRKAGIPASALELEITETVLMSDIRSVMTALYALRDEGFTIAVDDFGTGYSSLRYLHKFPVDVLKIDHSFVRDVEKNSESRAICTAIIAMAQSLNLKLVGEGVETKWQLEFLRRHNCDMVQGFMVSKPLSADDFADSLRRDSSQPDAGERVVRLPSIA